MRTLKICRIAAFVVGCVNSIIMFILPYSFASLLNVAAMFYMAYIYIKLSKQIKENV